VISPTQRPLPDNIQHSQETDIHSPAGFEHKIPASERPQTHALDHVVTGIGISINTRAVIYSTIPSTLTQYAYELNTLF
jgi:hypothetical protein